LSRFVLIHDKPIVVIALFLFFALWLSVIIVFCDHLLIAERHIAPFRLCPVRFNPVAVPNIARQVVLVLVISFGNRATLPFNRASQRFVSRVSTHVLSGSVLPFWHRKQAVHNWQLMLGNARSVAQRHRGQELSSTLKQ
jgi:hypothetical protein